MIRTLISNVCWSMVLLASLSACQGFDRLDYSQGFSRASWQQPDRVIQELDLSPNAIVADLGAGSGYFSQRFAGALPEGKIYAVEVTPELTRGLEELRVAENLNNLQVVSGAFADPKLPERVDLIFLVNTYHHIENQADYFALVREKYLKPGGRVATIDHRHDMSGIMRLFLSAGHWSDPTIVREQMRAAGFQETAAPDFLANQNFQIFSPIEAATQ
ncbi:MAG: methyltransferase [bacterium]|nr:methyltransferase [bacterium]